MAGQLKVRQKIGKYRIEGRLGEGGFATVYRAADTIEGIQVALKVLHTDYMTDEVLNGFRKEARTTSKLEHANILSIKDASIIDGRLVIALPLGQETLDQRLRRRMSIKTVLDISEQILSAVACAHNNRVVHCDIKPENVILFDGGNVRLTDFGIAKVAQKTLRGSGTGTVGYMAPEQAMGKPSFRSDVFSVGLILYRMMSGYWPEWPFEWPAPGFKKLKRRVAPEMVDLLKRAIEPNPKKRFRDAEHMLREFKVAKRRTLAMSTARKAA